MTAQSTDPTREEIDSLVEQTPPSGARRSMGFVAVVATLGSLLFGYDTSVISGALPYMYLPQAAHGLHLNSTEEGLVGGILLIGCACGAFFGGRLSDAYGRRHNILMLAVIFLFGALGCTLSPNIWFLYVARFILSLAVGGASATVPVYLAETAPKSIRGTLVGIDQLMIVTGQFLAFAVNAGIARITGGPEATVTSVFLFGINPHLDDAGNTMDTMPAMVPNLVVVVIIVYMLFMQGGNAPGTWVIMSELFPARMRGAAMGFAVLCLWVVNAIITFLFPVMMDKLGPVITYLTFSIINVVAVIYMYRNVPETKYSSLEELEEEFQQRYA